MPVPLRVALCLPLLLALLDPPVTAQSLAPWEGLQAGAHPVGFRAVETFDAARSFGAPIDASGRPRTAAARRPIQIAVWYPAQGAASGHPMAYGDYLSLLAWRPVPVPGSAAERAQAELEWLQAVTPRAGPPAAASMARLRSSRVLARREAEPASGPFPVLIYAPGSDYPAFDNSALFEFLASHGYLVLASPSFGAEARRIGLDAMGVDAQARDLEFLWGFARGLSSADAGRMAAAGFSGGGLPALLFALRHSGVKALVAIDGGFRDGQILPILRGFPHGRPERLGIPLLAFSCAPGFSPFREDAPDFLDQAQYADRSEVTLPEAPHHDLSSLSSLLRRCAQGGQVRDWEAATGAYEILCNACLAFLDRHLKGRPAPLPVIASRRPARKAPPTAPQLQEYLEQEGEARTAELVRRIRRDSPEAAIPLEAPLNQAGFERLAGGRIREALMLFELCAECFSDSLNAADSLGEALLAAGELDRAEACYRQVQRGLERLPARDRALLAASAERALTRLGKLRARAGK